jgi:hypothetical protein
MPMVCSDLTHAQFFVFPGSALPHWKRQNYWVFVPFTEDGAKWNLHYLALSEMTRLPHAGWSQNFERLRRQDIRASKLSEFWNNKES